MWPLASVRAAIRDSGSARQAIIPSVLLMARDGCIGICMSAAMGGCLHTVQVVQAMGQKLPQEHIDFYRAIDDLLWNEWDPIGISTMDWPRDEYHAYLPRVFSLAMGTNEPQVIADYLEWAAVERMALDPDMGHAMEIAGKVLAKKQEYGL